MLVKLYFSTLANQEGCLITTQGLFLALKVNRGRNRGRRRLEEQKSFLERRAEAMGVRLREVVIEVGQLEKRQSGT